MLNQIVALKNKANGVIPVGVPVSGRITSGGDMIDHQVTGIIMIQPTDDIEQRCLSGTGRPQDRDKFIFPKRQVDIVQCDMAIFPCPIAFLDLFYLNHSGNPPPSFAFKCAGNTERSPSIV